MKLTSRIERLGESATLRMAKLSRKLRHEGKDIISFSLGEPDFDAPDFVKEAAIQAIKDGYSHYPPVNGFLELRQAICKKFKRDNGLDFIPDQIVVSTGGKQALANLIFSLVEEGDEVVLPAPYWVTYPEQINLAGGTYVSIPTNVQDSYKFTAAQLDAALTQKTKLLIYSSPSNPSGTGYTKEELAAFAQVIKKYPNLIVISDEIYEHILFEGEKASISQFEEIRDQVVIVNGLSKAFAMTGWRLGYIAAPLPLAQACNKFQGQITSGANTIAQRAAITALTEDPSRIQFMVNSFKERRDITLNEMANIPGFVSHIPNGAFYVLPDISHYFGKNYGEYTINNAEDFALYLLYEANVAVVSGEPFGVPNCIRISYANATEQVIEGFRRIREACVKLL